MDNINTAEENYEIWKKQINFDTILLSQVGQFGSFQVRVLELAAIIVIFASWSANAFIFTSARVTTRCVIPECEGNNPEWSPYWLPNAIPAIGATTFDNCQRFANTSTSFRTREIVSDTCLGSLFNRNTLKPCEKYVYQNPDSVSSNFELACDEWRRSLIGTAKNLGTLTALPITGFMFYRWGIRNALTLNAVNTAWLGIVRYFANTYMGFTLSEFFEAMFGSGAFSSAFFLVIEFLGPSYRVAGGAALYTFFSLGKVSLGLMAWGIPNWRYLTLTLYVPQLLTVLYFCLMTESVRWYMSKGRFVDSEAILQKMAKTNGTQLFDESLQALRENTLEAERDKALKEEHIGKDPWLIVQVFRHERILLRVIASTVWWVTTTFIYYGLSMNAVYMAGNKYLNFVAVAAIEIPGYWAAVFLMPRIGRKPLLILTYWACAASQIAYIFIPDGMSAIALSVYMIAKFAIAMVMPTIYIYTAELYPTKNRYSMFVYASIIGKVGSIIATLTPAFGLQFWEELPFALFAGFALLSGCLIFTTPETLDSKLPDTFEEAYQIGLMSTNVYK